MQTPLKTILREVRNPANLDLVLPACIGMVFGILGVVGAVGFETLSAAILVVLAALSGSLLVNRFHARKLEELSDVLAPAVRLDREYPRAALPDLFERSTRISLLGITVASLDEHRASLEAALSRGTRVDVLLVQPTDAIAVWAAFRSHGNPDEAPASVMQDLNRRLERFALMRDRHQPHLTIKTIDQVPPYGMIITAHGSTPLAVHVKLLDFRVPNGRFPVIHIDSSKDVKWTHHFRGQFNSLWKAATDF